MLCWSLIGDSNCVFCRNALESRDHLFFDCSFTKRIWVSIMRLCLVSNPLFSWEDLIEWSSSNLKGKGMRSNICRLGLWAAVYHIWLQHNAIIHGGHIKTEEQIIKLIRKDVKARSENMLSYCDSILNRVLCCNWGIHSLVLRRKM